MVTDDVLTDATISLRLSRQRGSMLTILYWDLRALRLVIPFKRVLSIGAFHGSSCGVEVTTDKMPAHA